MTTTTTLPKLTWTQILEVGKSFSTVYGDWEVFLNRGGLEEHAANYEAFRLAWNLENTGDAEDERQNLTAIWEATPEVRKDVATLLTEVDPGGYADTISKLQSIN